MGSTLKGILNTSTFCKAQMSTDVTEAIVTHEKERMHLTKIAVKCFRVLYVIT